MRYRYAACSALIALAWATVANAQETAAPQQEASNGGQLEDIVVTAQKKATGESAQRVPVALTAVSAETLTRANATNISDVGRLAPSVALQTPASVPGFANFAIRGIGASGSTFSIDPAVNIVVDGMVYDFQGAVIIDTFDAEAVEILRGPQGILFGRNTTGGAVSVRTKRPTNEFQASGQITHGNYNYTQASGMVSGPIVSDTLLGKVSVMYRYRAGFFDDRDRGTFEPHVNNPTGTDPGVRVGNNPEEKTFVVRPTLVWKPTSNFEYTVLGEYVRMKGGAGAVQPIPGQAGLLHDKFGYTPAQGDFDNNSNIDGYTNVKGYRVVGEGNLDVGVGVITSVTGYRKVNYKAALDVDGTPFALVDFPFVGSHSRQFSQELRFASTFSDTVKLTVGAYYDNHKFDILEQRLQASLISNPAATMNSTLQLQGDFHQKAHSEAIFGNIDVNVTPELTLTAGGRYSWEKKKVSAVPLSLCTGANFTACPDVYADLSKSWNDFSPKVGAQYQLGRDTMVYASWTRGFRSGNYNSRATSVAQLGPANPEQASSAELGIKSTFWDRKARINLAVYQTKYDDIQRQVLIGAVQSLTNAASATIRGVELEATVRPVPALELNGSFGYTDAKYDEFKNFNVNSIPGIQPEDEELAKNLKFDRVPKYTAYGAIAYTFDVPGLDNGLTARADYSYRSHYYSDVINTPVLAQKGYGLLGANLTADWGHYKLSVWGKNLTNKRWMEFANRLIVPVRYGGEPRTYGITFGVSY